MNSFSIDSCPEAFVSNKEISNDVSRAVAQGQLRKLAARLYSRNLSDAPESIVLRNLWPLVAAYFPGALIADRTALELAPASDGSIFLIADRVRDLALPGIILRPRKGEGLQEGDMPFGNGLFLSSRPRAFLENMQPSRARVGVARTLGRRKIEERLETLMSRLQESEIKKLRDDVRNLAPALRLEKEAAEIDAMMGAMLGTRNAVLSTPAGLARQKGVPYDSARLALFHKLHAALRDWAPVTRATPKRNTQQRNVQAFYEAYFSNFIEGTEFEVSEAVEIIFEGKIPLTRPADAHDIMGVYRLAADPIESARVATSASDFISRLRSIHRTVMEGRPEKNPGCFKTAGNRAGNTSFVAPELVEGTLRQGYALLQSLEAPFARAVFMMFLVSEVHPFDDGNGRTARLIMNAELSFGKEERIIIPTVYRNNYLAALKALSLTDNPQPIIRALDFTWRWTAAINWQNVEVTRRELESCNAFANDDEDGKRLQLPHSTNES